MCKEDNEHLKDLSNQMNQDYEDQLISLRMNLKNISPKELNHNIKKLEEEKKAKKNFQKINFCTLNPFLDKNLVELRKKWVKSKMNFWKENKLSKI